MIKIYKAGKSLAQRLDEVNSEFKCWQSTVLKVAKVLGADGFVSNSRGQVTGLSFKSGSPPNEDLKLYRKSSVDFDGFRYFIPLASSKKHAELRTLVFDLRSRFYTEIGFDRSNRLMEPEPGLEKIGSSWIVKCENESQFFGKPLKWNEFIPDGCSRISDMHLEKLRRAS